MKSPFASNERAETRLDGDHLASSKPSEIELNTSTRLFTCLLATAAVSACATDPKSEQRSDDSRSAAFHLLPLQKTDAPLMRYIVAGKTYYWARSPCCDLPNPLYDERGKYVCAPSGGFSGLGDGKCPDLVKAMSAVKGELVPNPFYKP